MQKAAGIFLLRKDKHVLLCHPTNHPLNFFSIPKGLIDEDETLLDATIRECFEETNILLSPHFKFYPLLYSIYPNNKKCLTSFYILESENDIDFNSFDIKCNSRVPEDIGGFLEVDFHEWTHISNLVDKVHYTQKEHAKELIKQISL